MKEQVTDALWNQTDYLGWMLMTQTDLRQFRAVVHHLEAKQHVHHTWINTVPTPKPDETHGGPVFISVGQVIELDVSRSASRRLSNAQQDEIEPTTSTAALSVGNTHTIPG